MTIVLRPNLAAIKAILAQWARGSVLGESGAVSPIFALALVPLIGGLGMATEAANWYLSQRAMQNAADSAAIAAATNGTTACSAVGDFCYEAKAAAARSGYANGVNNVTVAATHTNNCPGSVTSCYQVTISKILPVNLLQVAGFTGNTTLNGAPAQTVQVTSIARAAGPGPTYCLMALGAGKSFTVNGGPNVNLAGCSMFSNGTLTCNGANSSNGAPYGTAVGTSNCGATSLSNQPSKTDPYSGLSGNIPANTCKSYPGGTINSATSFTSPVPKCGNTTLLTDVNITTPGAEIIVYNGTLNLNGHTLSTSGNGSATIIFSGPSVNSGSAINQYPTGSGTIDIAAPTSGTFGGVAIMQDANLTGSKNNLNMTYSGNNPTLDIQGLVYFPNGTFTIKGAINLHSSGLSCIGVIAQDILVSGTGSIFNNNVNAPTAQCALADVNLPTTPGVRLALVQ